MTASSLLLPKSARYIPRRKKSTTALDWCRWAFCLCTTKWRGARVSCWRGSCLASGALRRMRQAEVIPAVEPLARLSLANLELDEPVTVRDNLHLYLIDQQIDIQPLNAAALMRALNLPALKNLTPLDA